MKLDWVYLFLLPEASGPDIVVWHDWSIMLSSSLHDSCNLIKGKRGAWVVERISNSCWKPRALNRGNGKRGGGGWRLQLMPFITHCSPKPQNGFKVRPLFLASSDHGPFLLPHWWKSLGLWSFSASKLTVGKRVKPTTFDQFRCLQST